MVTKRSEKCLVTFLSIFVFFVCATVASGDPLDNWYVRNNSSTFTQTPPLSSIAFGNNIFVAVGDNGTILTSPDGITWSDTSPGTTKPWNYI